MKRVLFVAEAVTLAHVARPYALARSLDPARCEIHFAVADRFPLSFDGTPVRTWPLDSIAPEQFLSALAEGRPIYRYDELHEYLQQELALLDAIKPDVVVGDFRLSLSVSAPLRHVHYVSITNAHWSPYSTRRLLPFPEHALGKIFGVSIASRLFHLIQPMLLARHAAPLNRLRRKHGLAPLAGLRTAYTWADTTLYADVPELVPTVDLPGHHRYIGPIIWSPSVPAPLWWNQIPAEQTCVYVTLGSSGQMRALAPVLEGLSALPVTVLLATAQRLSNDKIAPNVNTAPYLDGVGAARRSAFVVCNGGSATVYQALAVGTPVLGIPSNLDQHLTMASVEEAEAGLTIRAEDATAAIVCDQARRLLEEARFKTAADKVSAWFAAYRADERFGDVINGILNRPA